MPSPADNTTDTAAASGKRQRKRSEKGASLEQEKERKRAKQTKKSVPTKQTLLVTKQPAAKKQDDEEEGTKNNASTTTKEGALPEKAEGGNIMAEKMGEEDMDIEKAGGGEVGIIVEKSLGEGKQISLQIPMDVVADAKAAAVLKEAAIAEDRAATNAEEAGIAEDGSATNAEEAAVTEDRAATADTQQTANESDAVEEATARRPRLGGTPSLLSNVLQAGADPMNNDGNIEEGVDLEVVERHTITPPENFKAAAWTHFSLPHPVHHKDVAQTVAICNLCPKKQY